MVQTARDLLEEALLGLTEEGPIVRKDVRTFVLFNDYLVNLLEGRGLAWRRHSFKNQGWATLLTMAVARDGVPLVGFFTGRTTTHCMGMFLRQLEEETIIWSRDKFA